MKAALCQMIVTGDHSENIKTAQTAIARAASEGADLAVLPEMFVCYYNRKGICGAAQPAGGEDWQAMSDAAAANGIYLAAGSMPESEDGHIYSTAYVFDRSGRQIGRYRKMHMFDVDVKDGIHYHESDILDPGSEITVVQTEFGPVGIALCYDVRFPEMFRLMAQKGARAVVLPASFSRATGPVHWELLVRARALDQEVYMLACAAAVNPQSSYNGWGHTLAVSPWGEVMGGLGEASGMLMTDLDFDYEDGVREQIPVMNQLRSDVYEVCEKLRKDVREVSEKP